MRTVQHSLPLFGAGAWLDWMGDTEEAIMYGLYSRVVPNDGSSDDIHCGRLRGPEKPEEQFPDNAVRLLGDEKWVITVLRNHVCVWRLQD